MSGKTLLFIFGKVIEFGFEDSFEETTQYSEKLEKDWITFWQTKGDEIVNSSWSHKYSDYLLTEEAEEYTPNHRNEQQPDTVDPLEQAEHQVGTENACHALEEESIDHLEGTGETLTSSREQEHQVEKENSPEQQDTEETLLQAELDQLESRLTEQTLKHQEYIDEVLLTNLGNNNLQAKTDELLCQKEPNHLKEDNTVETLLPQSLEETYLVAEPAELSWQEVWDEHYSGVYQETYKLYSIAHHNQYSFYRPRIDEIEEEYSPDRKEDEEEFLTQKEELLALGLPTSFRGGSKYYNISKLYDSCSESMTDEEAEMGSTEIAEKPEKRRKKNNRKLRRVPKVILENKSLRPYWQKRFSLFSRFEEGIQLDRESWFSVTPEKVAIHMAERLSCDTIIDAFCGSGGNAIQFAFACAKVIAIDIDAEKIKNARHNAVIYGVANKIDFIIGDFLQLCDSLKGDVVFLSPPWGGPKYLSKKEYDIEESLEPVGASALAEKARQISENIAFFLPRNSIPQQIAKLAGVGNRVEIEHNFLDTRLIGLTAIYGDWLIDKKNLSDK